MKQKDTEASTYALGHSEEELERLGRQAQAFFLEFSTNKFARECLRGTNGWAVICRRNEGSHRPGMPAPQDGQQP